MDSDTNTSNKQPKDSEQNQYNKIDAYKNLDIINMWICNADNKILYSIAFMGVLLGFFFVGDKPINVNDAIDRIYNRGLRYLTLKECILLLLMCGFIITSILAIVFLYIGVKGRTDSSVYKQDKLVTNSNIFWNTISNKSFKNYYKSMLNSNKEDIVKDISSQIYINSKICSTKFSNYNKGRFLIVVSVILFFIYKTLGAILL